MGRLNTANQARAQSPAVIGEGGKTTLVGDITSGLQKGTLAAGSDRVGSGQLAGPGRPWDALDSPGQPQPGRLLSSGVWACRIKKPGVAFRLDAMQVKSQTTAVCRHGAGTPRWGPGPSRGVAVATSTLELYSKASCAPSRRDRCYVRRQAARRDLEVPVLPVSPRGTCPKKGPCPSAPRCAGSGRARGAGGAAAEMQQHQAVNSRPRLSVMRMGCAVARWSTTLFRVEHAV